MILDLHSHSIKSDDGRAKVESYCRWVRKRSVPIDGFVLTEHRQFDLDSDYRKLEDEFGILILKGSEVETDYGHVLVFGVSDEMQRAFDFGSISLKLAQIIPEINRCGGIAVPCHPGRPTVGLATHYQERGPVEGVQIIEVKNGGSRVGEDEAAEAVAREFGYLGVAGSDAHLVSQIGSCTTKFEQDIRCEEDLVEALKSGRFEALSWRS